MKIYYFGNPVLPEQASVITNQFVLKDNMHNSVKHIYLDVTILRGTELQIIITLYGPPN